MNQPDRHRGTDYIGSSVVPPVHYRTLVFFATLLAGACGGLAFAQAAPATEQPVVITVESDNTVLYRADTYDITKIAKTPTLTTSVNQAFIASISVGDVKMLNGQPATGLWSYQVALAMPFRTNPQPGQPIADLDTGGIFQCIWHILSPDGKFIGDLIDSGSAMSAQSPQHILTGGSGAFQGMTGVHGAMQMITPQRMASTSEDPSTRRIYGGGKIRVVFYLYPRTRPAVVSTAAGLAVVHQDGKLVSSANPAQAGELLTLYATGLGPTTPAVDPGQPFTKGTTYVANAVVEVRVNGQPSPVLYAGGYPDAIDGYQVNFRLPPQLAPGTASLGLSAAWVPGPQITIATR